MSLDFKDWNKETITYDNNGRKFVAVSDGRPGGWNWTGPDGRSGTINHSGRFEASMLLVNEAMKDHDEARSYRGAPKQNRSVQADAMGNSLGDAPLRGWR